MAGWNGLGRVTLTYSWVQDNANGVYITDSRMDQEFQDVVGALQNCMTLTGETVPVANIPMGGFKFTGYGTTNAPNARSDIPQAGQVQDSAFMWGGTATGSANAIALAPTPAITAYAAGQVFRFKAASANTGTATVAISGLAPQALVRPGGTKFSGSEILAGATVEIVYDGAQFQLASFVNPTVSASWGNATTSVFNVERAARRARQYAAGL